jgi:hypothetical protein
MAEVMNFSGHRAVDFFEMARANIELAMTIAFEPRCADCAQRSIVDVFELARRAKRRLAEVIAEASEEKEEDDEDDSTKT